jgi:hypothetical protein
MTRQIITLQEKDQVDRCLVDYRLAKERYLTLCRIYSLNPYDLDLRNHALKRLPRRDKVQIVRLMLRIIRIERTLRDRIEGNILFPLTIEQSERSGYLVPRPVAAR